MEAGIRSSTLFLAVGGAPLHGRTAHGVAAQVGLASASEIEGSPMAYGFARALPGDQIGITTNPDTEPFWLAAKEHRLTACQCASCGHFRMPPTPFCPQCQSSEKNWPDLPGTGTIFSFAICSTNPATGESYVYVPTVVSLDGTDDARLVSNLTGIEAEDVKIGMKVVVDWNPIQQGRTLPIFRPVWAE